MGQLQRLFTEGAVARVLREEDDSVSHQSGASGGSLDSQIDRYFGEYEASAKKTEDDMGSEASVDQLESRDWRDLIKGRMIVEAGEGDKDDEDEDPDADAPGADALTGDNDDKPGIDTINVENFGNDVARLIENYDSLLEIRSTLLRRARSFLQKTYDDDVVDAFISTMRDDHGMEAGNSPEDIEADRFTAPAADRANGSAASSGGGGAPI